MASYHREDGEERPSRTGAKGANRPSFSRIDSAQEIRVLRDDRSAKEEFRLLFKLAAPTIVQTASQQAMAFTDQIFLGHLGTEEMAAAALGNMYTAFLTFFLLGTATALDTLGSQAYGAAKRGVKGTSLVTWCFTSFVVLTLLCVPVTAFMLLGYPVGHVVLGQDPTISRLISDYCNALIPGIWAMMWSTVLMKYLQVQNVMAAPAIVTAATFGLNIGANFVFIDAFGFKGAPWATSFSRIMQFLVLGAMVYYYNHVQGTQQSRLVTWLFNAADEGEAPLLQETTVDGTIAAVTAMQSHVSPGVVAMAPMSHGVPTMHGSGTLHGDTSHRATSVHGAGALHGAISVHGPAAAVHGDEELGLARSSTRQGPAGSPIIPQDSARQHGQGAVSGVTDTRQHGTSDTHEPSSQAQTTGGLASPAPAAAASGAGQGSVQGTLYDDVPLHDDASKVERDTSKVQARAFEVDATGVSSKAEPGSSKGHVTLVEMSRFLWHESKESVQPHLLWTYLKLGLPGGVMMACEQGAFDVTTAMAGRLGPVVVAAHSAMLNVVQLTFVSCPFAVGIAGSIRVGNLLGEALPRTARKSGWLCVAVGGGFMACSAVVVISARHVIGHIFTSDAEVISIVATIAPMVALFQVSDGLMGCAAGVLRGCGKQRLLMVYNIVGFWMSGVLVGYLLCFHAGLGVVGLWWGIALGDSVTAVMNLITLSLVNWQRESDRAQKMHNAAPDEITHSLHGSGNLEGSRNGHHVTHGPCDEEAGHVHPRDVETANVTGTATGPLATMPVWRAQTAPALWPRDTSQDPCDYDGDDKEKQSLLGQGVKSASSA